MARIFMARVVAALAFAAIAACMQAEAQAADHTTYVVSLPGADRSTFARIEAAGGVIDHFDGGTARVYVHRANWEAFLATGVPYTLVEVQPAPSKKAAGYPSYSEVGDTLQQAEEDYPNLVRVISLGQSVQGRELWAIRITDHPDTQEDEPEFAYIATIHGDEPPGTVLCLNFLALLLEGYGQDVSITALVDGTDIWIVPLMNPDGYELGVRWNANNLDLNRSFPQYPDHFTGTLFSDGAPSTAGREPEVAHIMNWSAANSFTLAANYHTGALVANYPYDEEPGIPSGVAALSPDEDLLRDISLSYAGLNPPMSNSPVFTDGVTNGSAWYSLSGGLQDWHYRHAGAPHVTLEISNIKIPTASGLPDLWEDNRESMFAYLNRVHRGVRGLITDRITGAPLYAQVLAGDNPQPVFTDPDVGDYYRLLLPGTHTIRVEAPGYIPYTAENIVVNEGEAARANVALSDGDVDRDGSVTAADLQLVINAVLELNTLEDADVDGGGVSATDVQHLINRVLLR